MARYNMDADIVSARAGAPRKEASGRARLLYPAIGLAAAVLAVAAFMAVRPKRTVPPTADRRDVVKFIASDEFVGLPTEQKKPYLEALGNNPREFFEVARNSGLDDERRRQLMENVFMARMQEQVDGYFALPPGRQRVAYLDRLIDEGERRREEWAARRATQPARPEGDRPRMGRGPDGPGGDGQSGAAAQSGRGDGQGPAAAPGGGGDGQGRRGRGMTAERIKSRMENTPAEVRARWAEFRKALSDRRKERGLPEGPRRPGPR